MVPRLTYKRHGAKMAILEGRPLRRLALGFLRSCFYVELLRQVLALLLCHLPVAMYTQVRRH